MFGIGAQEMVLIGVLFLIIFGPGKFVETARELGKFTRKARGSIDEFKSEFETAGHGETRTPEYRADYSTEEELEPEQVR
jgi:Sec-independent protein translocase protein TatA